MANTITISDIAREVGVSHPVVSKVINGGRSNLRVSDKRRREIEQAAARLGYRTNVAAQAIKTGKTNCLGVITGEPETRSGISPKTLGAIQERMLDSDQRLAMAMISQDQAGDERAVPSLVRDWSADGLIISYHPPIPGAIMGTIERCRIPHVWINVKLPENCIYPDDFDGARQAVRRLVELGHRRIMYAGPKTGSHYSTGDRMAGYQEAMDEAGLYPQIMHSRLTDPDKPAAMHAADLLKQPDRPTALLCYRAGDAAAFFHGALIAGLSVPHDLSVLTFADHVLNESGASLSFMVIPNRDIGSLAYDLLEERIGQPNRPLPSRPVPFRFYDGGSVGPVGS